MKVKGYQLYSLVNQKIIDALIAGFSFSLAYQIRFEWHVPGASAFQQLALLPAIMLGRLLSGTIFGSYRLIWRYIGLDDAIILARNNAVFSLVLLPIRLIAPESLWLIKVPLSIIIVELVFTLALMLGARSLRRLQLEGLGKNRL